MSQEVSTPLVNHPCIFKHNGRALIALPDTVHISNGGNEDCIGCIGSYKDLDEGTDRYDEQKAYCRSLPDCGDENAFGWEFVLFVDDTPENRVKLVGHLLTR